MKEEDIDNANKIIEAVVLTSTAADPARVVSLELEGEIELTPEHYEQALKAAVKEDEAIREAGARKAGRPMLAESLPWKALDKPASIEEVSRGELIDFDPILALHRHEDGYITFSRKNLDGTFEQLAALRPKELRSIFPELRSTLVRDAYFGVNADYKAGAMNRHGFQMPLHRKKWLRWLNCCHVDIDCGRPDDPEPYKRADPEFILAMILRLARAKEIPFPSMVAYSGRGVYAFWFLSGNEPDDPALRATSKNLAVVESVNKAIAERLKECGADPGAWDSTRVLRVPGTLHSKSGQPASYTVTILPNSPRGSRYYSIEEMAHAFDVRLLPHDTSGTLPQIPKDLTEQRRKVYLEPRKRIPNNRRGYEVVRIRLVSDLEKLEVFTGGWKKPGRRKRLTIYARLLHQLDPDGFSKAETLTRLSKMAANCLPKYPSDPSDAQTIKKLFSEATSKKRKSEFPREPLITMFKVTPEIARSLELEYLVPMVVRLEREQVKAESKQDRKRTARHRILKELVERKGGIVPTQREARLYLEQKGHAVSVGTIVNDYRTLGIIRGEGTRGRPRKKKD